MFAIHTKLWLVLNALMVSHTLQQGPPDDHFLPPAPNFGHHEKMRTVFDGVTTSEAPTTYFHLDSKGALSLPISSSNSQGEPMDYTIKFWFKYSAAELSDAAKPNESMLQLMDLANSVRCFASGNLDILCEVPGAQRLMVSLNQVFSPGQWLHFALTVTKNGQADLMVFNKKGKMVRDSVNQFYLQQDDQDWVLCFGYCDSSLKGVTVGMPVGIREVAVINAALSEDSIIGWANKIFTHDSRIKAYYRFNADNEARFMQDQFRVRRADYFSPHNSQDDSDNLPIEQEYMPTDMCPKTFETADLIRFDMNQKILPADLDSAKLKETNYAYSMSVTLLLDENSCFTQSVTEAAEDCNLVLVDGIFMLYLYKPNVGRFFFDAQKRYYQSQSSQFFVPYNQWITIQMQMTQSEGYQIVIIDQEGLVLTNFARSMDMRRQKPKKDVALFSALSGSATKFLFTDKAYFVPVKSSNFEDPLFSIDLKDQDGSRIVPNSGSRSQMQLNSAPVFETMLYGVVEYGETALPQPDFDGITCDDDHVTLQLSTYQSSFSFRTPEQSDWMSETTIQFWFKLTSWSQIGANQTEALNILHMAAAEDKNYWSVYINDGQLTIAPFGTSSPSNPSITISEFSEANEDPLGWWHLSCFYQFNAKAQCTLYNQNIEVSEEVSVSEQPQFYFEKASLRAVFGSYQDLAAVRGMLLKEVRYWSKKITAKETEWMRFRQLDPSKAPSLMNYFRLAAGSKKVMDLAIQEEPITIQPVTSLNNTNSTNATNPTNSTNGQDVQEKLVLPQLVRVSFVADYILKTVQVYDEATKSLLDQQHKTYHNVCPLQTYLRNGYCYSDPVNTQHLMIFPKWDAKTQNLDWIFTMQHSQMIRDDLFLQLNAEWASTDPAFNSILAQMSDSQIQVSSTKIRQDGTYKVTGALTNMQGIFSEIDAVSFVPNKCQWFEFVSSNDAFSATRTIEQPPSQKDIVFQLNLVRNPSLDCENFMFYDSFKDIHFDFVYQDSLEDSYMMENPKVEYQIFSPSLGAQADLSKVRTASDLVIEVTIPIKEQYRMPVWTNIKVLMTIDWTSAEFQEYLTEQKTVFQSALYTIRFDPVDVFLVVDLKQNLQYVQKGETFILFANRTTVDGLHPESVRKMISYKWMCPETLEALCENQTQSIYYLPWNKLAKSNVSFAVSYTFGVEVTWTKLDGKKEVRQKYAQVIFYNVQIPTFNIVTSPAKILATSTQDTIFTIEGVNFDSSGDMSVYEIEWTVKPEIKSPWARTTHNFGQRMEVEAGNWAQNSVYTVGVNLVFKKEPGIQNYKELQFQTFAPPKGGSVSITPEFGYVGENFTISVTGFSSASAVSFNVFNSYDWEGTRTGAQLNSRPVAQNDPYIFTAQSEYALIVEVVNTKGEFVNVVLSPEIVVRPKPLCTTDVIACVAANSTETAEGDGRRLQSNKTDSGITTTTVINKTNDGKECTYITRCIAQEFLFGESNRTIVTRVQAENVVEELSPPEVQPNSESASGEATNSGRRLRVASAADNQLCETSQTNLQQAHAQGNTNAVIKVLDDLMSINSSVNYKSDLMQVSSFIVGHWAAAQTLTLDLLDAAFEFQTESLQWYFPDAASHDFILQGIAIKDVDQATLVFVRVIDSVTDESFALSELDGQVKITFQVGSAMDYVAGQTVCQAKLAGEWNSQVCLSEIQTEQRSVLCTCSLTEDDNSLVSLKTNTGLEALDRVDFERLQASNAKEIDISSNYLIVSAIAMSVIGLIGMVAAWKGDNRELKASVNLCTWQRELIKGVAAQLNEPVETTKLRHRDIFNFHVNRQLLSMLALNKIHPLLAPQSHSVTQTRLMRFAAYWLQINLFAIGIMNAFGPSYRAEDNQRQELLFDNNDIQAVQTAILVGAAALLPWCMVCNWFFANEITFSPSNKVTVKRSKVPLQTAFILICCIVNVLLVAQAIHVAITAPTANQFLICSAIFASLCAATFISNAAVVLVVQQLPECLQPGDLRRALRDVSAVRAFEKMRDSKQGEHESTKSNVQSTEESTKRAITTEPDKTAHIVI